ncbi:hypothetical protein [Streptodolium elevatio]|uniref:Uncharacterized protein n=1 Tax=Streptodolium elevatio TaxID=3157996 RepID=A0ABV3DWE6_9ACTN
MTDKLRATRDTADKQLEFLAAKAVGRRLTRGTREELGWLAELLRAEGRECEPIQFATVQRPHSGHLPVRELDFDLIDAALHAGVPFAPPPPGTVVSLRAWADRAQRGGLVTLAADPRFRPLLREAIFYRPGELLALGRPGSVLSDHDGLADAVLGAPGLLGVVQEAVVSWAEGVRAGSLPILHEAVYFLDVLGPARLAEACPELRSTVTELLTAHIAEAVATTWRGGLVDELGDPALDRFGSFWSNDDAFRMEPEDGADEDSFVVANSGRATIFGPRGVVAGPLYLRFPAEPGSSTTSDRFRYEHGQFTASAPPADDVSPTVLLPGATAPAMLRRGHDGWWELRDTKDVVVGRWYQGASRPTRAAGTHSVGRRRHRWAAGSTLVPPPQVWGRLVPRDAAGSRLLRGADAALAARALDSVDDRLADLITGIGRRIPVGDHSHEVDDCFDGLRAVLEPLFPGVVSDGLLDGIAGTVWSAVECRVLSARHIGPPASGSDGDAPGGAALRLRDDPSPYPITDAGDLRARIFTEMQEMFFRLSRVADKCADPEVATPPLTVRLANARGWENSLGRLGCRALRTALSPTAPSQRSRELEADHVRAWGGPALCDPAGRWRTLSLRLDVGTVPREGEVCRTKRGCLIALQRPHGSQSVIAAIEYAADGVFDERPFGVVESQRVCAGWGGADRVAAFLRLLDARGSAPWPGASIRAFGEATGLSVEEASLLAVGFDPYDAYLIGRGAHGMPGPLVERSGLSEERLKEAGRFLARHATVNQRLEVPELLMPDDPADVWADRLTAERAAEWWNANVRTPADGTAPST